jgi:hypothetical protein
MVTWHHHTTGARNGSGPCSANGTRALTCSALGGTRTPNLLIRSQMLYPLSYERSLNPPQCTAPRVSSAHARLRRTSWYIT